MSTARTTPPLALALPPAVQTPIGSAGSLLERLARGLDQERIRYCQWKGHWSAHRWTTGQGDLDLLVDHAGRSAFRLLVEQLGFKLGHPPAGRQIPGIEHYIGYDSSISRLLHLHVHYRLLLGDYWKPIYRIPIEQPLLDHAVAGSLFRVPAPAYQYLVFVLRMMLRQVGRPLLSAQTLWTTGIRIQLESLEACSGREDLATALREHLSPVDLQLFDRCVRSLQGRCGLLERAALPWVLHRRLRAHVRSPALGGLLSAAVEKLTPPAVAERIADGRLCLSDSGAVVALVGGDGAGKSTCARELNDWLAPAFRTMWAHLGNPPRSWLTLAVGATLKLEQRMDRMLKRTERMPTTIELLRHLCTARDRYRLYIKVRRFAVNGGIAICERYPIAQNRRLVGPCIPDVLPAKAGPVGTLLRQLEATYYERILRPDAVVVLRLDPELAVARKPEEPAEYVRTRGKIIYETDWSATGAQVVDASQPLTDVVRRLKAIIWAVL